MTPTYREFVNSDTCFLFPGRSWTTPELRLKSFRDLHILWYVLLRERNVLATQREEKRRLGLQLDGELLTKRGFRVSLMILSTMLVETALLTFIPCSLYYQCRKTMARIKYVLNERRLALIATAESTRPNASATKVHGTSPLGRADPMSLTGWEKTSSIPFSFDLDSSQAARDTGDGERQKLDVEEPVDPVVEGESVAKEEIEGRDEGFGSGEEAKEFVKNTKV